MGVQTEGSLELLQKTRRCRFLSKPCFWTWSYKACLAFNISTTLLPIHSLQQTGVCPEGINRLFEIWRTSINPLSRPVCGSVGIKTAGLKHEASPLRFSCWTCHYVTHGGCFPFVLLASYTCCLALVLHWPRLVVKSLEHAPMAQRPRLVM